MEMHLPLWNDNLPLAFWNFWASLYYTSTSNVNKKCTSAGFPHPSTCLIMLVMKIKCLFINYNERQVHLVTEEVPHERRDEALEAGKGKFRPLLIFTENKNSKPFF